MKSIIHHAKRVAWGVGLHNVVLHRGP